MKSRQNNHFKSGLLIIITIILTIGLFFTVKSFFNDNNTKNIGCNEEIGVCGVPNIDETDYIEDEYYDEYYAEEYPGDYPEGIIQETKNEDINDLLNYEKIEVGHDQFFMNPETTVLQAGKNYKVIITPTANGGGCMSTLTIPGINENIYRIKKDIPITITINNAKAGVYEIVCGAMGMYQGQIIVQ